jgi:hypothetical protein
MSDKPIAQKLLIKPRARVWATPSGAIDHLGPLPDGADLADGPVDATVAVAFVDDATGARALMADHGAQLADVAVFWIAYPKGNRSDINRDSLWPIIAEHGLRPITQVAIDDTWSALRFRRLQPGEEPFTGGR